MKDVLRSSETFSDDPKPISLRYYSIPKTNVVKQPSSADKPISCRSK
ncbi:hypothetical protein [Neisseria sicca]|nr:hypothetical protein [Neisseria sicca]